MLSKSNVGELLFRSDPKKLLFQQKEGKRKKAEGYDEADTATGVMFHTLPASQFIDSPDYIDLLSKASKVCW